MAKEKSPAFQFYPREYQADENVRAMSLAERGAYMDLMCVCWTEGSIPADLKRLARIVGVTVPEMEEMWEFLGPCFDPDPDNADRLRHGRLDVERSKQREWREQKRAAGKASARARARKSKGGNDKERRSNDRSAHAQQQEKQQTGDGRQESSDGYPSPTKATGGNYPEAFEAAWAAYPSRPGANKRQAYRAWLATVRRGGDEAEIAQGVERYARFCKLTKTEPRFVKQPATFMGPDEHWRLDWDPPPNTPDPEAVQESEVAAKRRAAERQEQDRQVEADQLLLQRWKKEHPEDLAAIEAEVAQDPAAKGPGGRIYIIGAVNRRIHERIEEGRRAG